MPEKNAYTAFLVFTKARFSKKNSTQKFLPQILKKIFLSGSKFLIEKVEKLILKTEKKLYCGSNFIEAIADGSLYIEFLDNRQQYQMTDFNYFRNANTGSFVTTTKQFQ